MLRSNLAVPPFRISMFDQRGSSMAQPVQMVQWTARAVRHNLPLFAACCCGDATYIVADDRDHPSGFVRMVLVMLVGGPRA